MPGYEPFLLCDFHVHTTWSDGRLSVRDVVDLYGQTGRFDVIAITDHILMKRDLGRPSRQASVGSTKRSVTAQQFDGYLDDIATEAKRAKQRYGLLVIPGAEITQKHSWSRKTTHIVVLNIQEHISADQPAEGILREIERQGAISIACHPQHRTTRRIEINTCYQWNHRRRLFGLIDERAAKHLYSWKALLKCDKYWGAIAEAIRSNDVALTLYRNGSSAA